MRPVSPSLTGYRSPSLIRSPVIAQTYRVSLFGSCVLTARVIFSPVLAIRLPPKTVLTLTSLPQNGSFFERDNQLQTSPSPTHRLPQVLLKLPRRARVDVTQNLYAVDGIQGITRGGPGSARRMDD